MNFDFSIESSFDKIQNPKTKEYFKEVYQTFVNGNYRSSTVMLYSVLICDLVYKLRDLRDIYADGKAGKIIEEVENLQQQNPKSPEWESKLIEMIKQRTTLLNHSDIISIDLLQQNRHLAAHPVLDSADLLFAPNKETVQALIRNILEGILINPPFFSNKIFDTMLSDLIEVKDKLTDMSSLEKYLKSRYLSRIKETDYKKTFRSLWKIVYASKDEKAEENRSINSKALTIMVGYNKQVCLDAFKDESDFYCNLIRTECFTRAINFFARFPEFYRYTTDSFKLLLEKEVESDDNHLFKAWFLSESLQQHLNNLDYDDITGISARSFIFMKELCTQNNCIKELIDFSINYFGASHSFDETLKRYNSVLSNIAPLLSLQQAKKVLELSNNNSQIYSRIGIRPKLRTITDLFEDDLSLSQYDKLSR